VTPSTGLELENASNSRAPAKKRIVIGSYEVPCHGGASTSSYQLFEKMYRDGLDVHFVNLISEHDGDYFRYLFGEQIGNPRGLSNVHNCFLSRPLFHAKPNHTELAECIDALAPDILLGVDFIATLLMKREFPDLPVIFLTAGCDQAKYWLTSGLATHATHLCEVLQAAPGLPTLSKSREAEAAANADLIVTHSELNRWFYQHFYPLHVGKIYSRVISFAEWIYQDARRYSDLSKPFSERDIDLLFVASIWERPEKNYALLQEILPGCNGLRVHLVGETRSPPPGVTHHGFLIDRDALFALFGRARTVVNTSALDAAPGILFEASAMGCNVIASKNCGNWQICNAALLAEPYEPRTYLEKIGRSLERKYEDNMDDFLRANSYDDLVDTLLAF
jgi:glycosyltransferase involved in cell wall biosynthesis